MTINYHCLKYITLVDREAWFSSNSSQESFDCLLFFLLFRLNVNKCYILWLFQPSKFASALGFHSLRRQKNAEAIPSIIDITVCV